MLDKIITFIGFILGMGFIAFLLSVESIVNMLLGG